MASELPIQLRLEKINKELKQANEQLKKMEAVEKAGEAFIIDEEFEKALHEIYKIKESLELITTTKRGQQGSLDELESTYKEKLREFFNTQYKQKKYEGSYLEMGYTTVERKVVDGKPADTFVVYKPTPNTKAINEYKKATGELPEGIKVTTYDYIRFKEIL